MRKAFGKISSAGKSPVFMDLVRKKHPSIGCIASFLLHFLGNKAMVLDLVQRPISLDKDDAEREAVNGRASSLQLQCPETRATSVLS